MTSPNDCRRRRIWGAFLVGAVCGAAAAGFSPAASARPPLKDACKLVTGSEIKTLMGRRPVERRGGPEGCVWTTRPATYKGDAGRRAEDIGLELLGYQNLRQAKEYVDLRTRPVGCDWDRLLPGRGRPGDDAWLQDCNAGVLFRLGRIVGEVTTFTNDVREGSRADVSRTVSLTRKAVAGLRRYRCDPPLCPR